MVRGSTSNRSTGTSITASMRRVANTFSYSVTLNIGSFLSINHDSMLVMNPTRKALSTDVVVRMTRIHSTQNLLGSQVLQYKEEDDDELEVEKGSSFISVGSGVQRGNSSR